MEVAWVKVSEHCFDSALKICTPMCFHSVRSVFWHNSASKSNIGPGFYEYDDKAPRSVSFNFG